MAESSPDDEARNRWLVIQVMRIGGIAFVILGLLMTQGVVDLAGEDNDLVAYGFIVVGLLDGFLVPTYLARKWSSRER